MSTITDKSKKTSKSTPKKSAFDASPSTTSKENSVVVFYRKLSIGKTNFLKFSLIILSVLFVGVSSVAAYSYHLYQQSEKRVDALKNNKETAKLETQKIIDAVAKLIILPKDETPTIATVTDSSKLKNQAFFSKASNGDKVLIYTKGKKAILYNPTQNKVVEVAPLNLGKNNKADVAGVATQPTQVPQIPTPTIATQVQPIVTYPPVAPTTTP